MGPSRTALIILNWKSFASVGPGYDNCAQNRTGLCECACGCRPLISLFLRPKIHGYTGCKRTGCVKPGSVKLAMGHLLHGETAPWICAVQIPVPPWIQGLLRQDLSTLLWHVAQCTCVSGGVERVSGGAVDPLSATVVPLHLTQFTVPLGQIVTTVC